MDHNTKDEAQKEVEKKNEGGEAAVQNTSGSSESEGQSVPADRDAGSLDHGELGGNFNEETEDRENQ
jgi:hypothetical protein